MAMEIYCNDEILSSIINDGITFYAFLREDHTRTKSTKSMKVQKAQKA